MASTSVISSVLVALQSALEGRGGLEGVTISRFTQKLESLGREHIILMTRTPGTLTPRSMPVRQFDEVFTFHGVLCAWGEGQGQDAAQAALDRALELFAEVQSALIEDTQLNETCRQALPVSYEHIPASDGQSYQHYIEFDIEVKAFLN